MRILLDTQVWLWMLMSPDRLCAQGRDLVEDPSNELLLSAASTWEIAIKASLGRLELPGPPEAAIPEMIESSQVTPLPILLPHTLRVAALPRHHRDPFDRLLVAQAQLEAVPILTADARIGAYDVEVLRP